MASVEWRGKTLHFNVLTVNALWRVETFKTKEPETLDWIPGFKSDDVLLDVGANVGMHTIAAASVGAQVYAIEPAFFNFALLNRNIITIGFNLAKNVFQVHCVEPVS